MERLGNIVKTGDIISESGFQGWVSGGEFQGVGFRGLSTKVTTS